MDAESVLALFPALDRLSPEGRRTIVREGKILLVPGGTVLQHKGDACSGLPLVAAGEIQVRAVGPEGRSMHLYSIGRGQTCVLTAGCLLSDERFAAEAVTAEPTSALLIPAPILKTLVATEPALRELVFASVAGRLGEMFEVVEDVAFGRLDARVAEWLAQAEVVALTHQEIAVRFGSARQVVSRLLGDWQRRGWIRQERGKIEVLDRVALGNLGDRREAPTG